MSENDSSPIISSNVIEALLNIYTTSNEQHLLRVLSTSPSTSVVRVNPTHEDFNNAQHILQKHLDETPRGATFRVSPHHLLNDVMIVSTNEKSPSVDLTRNEKDVIVDTNCGSALLRGADVFAPGVLAAHPCMLANDLVSVYVDLEGKCRRGLTKKFTGRKYFVGNGVALFSRQQLFEDNASVKGTGIRMVACRSHHPTFSTLPTSLFFPQNLPSTVVAHVMSPCEGDTVLDMCAAPGGKTTHIASLMGNCGKVVALDKSQNKVDRITANYRNLGLTNISAYAFDSTKLLREASCKDSSGVGPPFPAESFDKILLDPPCSGLGQRPQLRYQASAKELSSYPALQKKLLKQAVGLLKPGGCLVYSTCTLLPEENESQVAWVLDTYPQLQLASQSPVLGRGGLSGFGLPDAECEKVQRFDWCFMPSESIVSLEQSDRDTIGFFIAKFVKKSNAS